MVCIVSSRPACTEDTVSKTEKSFLNIVWSGGGGPRRGQKTALRSCFSFLPSQGFLGSNSSQKAFVVPFSAAPPFLPLNLWNSLCVASFYEKCFTLTVFLICQKIYKFHLDYYKKNLDSVPLRIIFVCVCFFVLIGNWLDRAQVQYVSRTAVSLSAPFNPLLKIGV